MAYEDNRDKEVRVVKVEDSRNNRIIQQCKLECGHWVETTDRFCKHCGAKIVG